MKQVVVNSEGVQWGFIKEQYPDMLYYYYGRFDGEELIPWFFIEFKPVNWKGEPELRLVLTRTAVYDPEDIMSINLLMKDATHVYEQLRLTKLVT